MPDITGILVACGAVMFTAHIWTFWPQIQNLLHRLRHGREGGDDVESKERMEAAFWEASIQQYLLASSCWAHLGAIIMPGLIIHYVCIGGSAFDSFHLFTLMAAWAFHFSTTAQIVKLTPSRMRLLSIGNFFLMAAFGQKDQTDENIVAITAVQTASRFANAALFVDIKTNIPIQLLGTLLQIRAAWLHDPNLFFPAMVVQSVVTIIILLVSCLLEFSIRSRIAMLLDSESMVSSFRKMLRGVCDGEALLDSNFKITGKADCLKSLLMTRHEFSGERFEQLLVNEERQRFHDFMADPGGHTDAEASAPRCLRVSLTRGKVRVGVDLFHVKVPHIFGKNHHLVAFREDSESRLAPLHLEEANGDTKTESSLLAARGHSALSSARSARSARSSARSASSCASEATALLQMCNELQEMTLMIDANTQLLDVEQAHLSFLRRDSGGSMPSFRRLVQPTDWGSVRDQLVEFAQRQSGLPGQEREVLKTKMRLQDAKRCVQARKVEVTAFSPAVNPNADPPLKLRIHLSRLKPLKTTTKHQSTLPGLFENSEESSQQSI